MFKLILILCMTLFALTGCGRVTVPDTDEKEQSTIPVKEIARRETTAPIGEIAVKEAGSFTAQVKEFDLGAKEYEASSGKIMPYHLRGVIGLPEGKGPFPLVLITHGSHNNIKKDLRFDTGYSYLVEALAQNGYLAISMDMSSAYLWEYGEGDDLEKSLFLSSEHIKSLQSVDRGEANAYPVDIMDKIDWKRVAVAGHSRGGVAAIQIAQQQKELNVGAVLAIAPALPGDVEAMEWPQCPISILVQEYDGDVISLDGFAFDAILDDQSDQMHAVTYLLKGNHNYFNKNITANDALLGRAEEELSNQLEPEVQQQFLAQFAVDYFDAVWKNEKESSFYTAAAVQPDKMYGLDVLTRLRIPGASVITNLQSGNFEAKGLLANKVKDSWFYQEDQVAIDTITFGNDFYKTKPLLDIRWQDKKGTLSLVPLQTDFSTSQSLNLETVVDSADENNNHGQNFTVELKDADGNIAAVVLPKELNTLKATAGKLEHTPIDEKDYIFWTPITPIGSLRIPLSLFEGLDLSRIESVSLRFDQTERGSLYLQNIWLQ